MTSSTHPLQPVLCLWLASFLDSPALPVHFHPGCTCWLCRWPSLSSRACWLWSLLRDLREGKVERANQDCQCSTNCWDTAIVSKGTIIKWILEDVVCSGSSNQWRQLNKCFYTFSSSQIKLKMFFNQTHTLEYHLYTQFIKK